ncbi:hypothetical protein ACH5RR_028913 [Cinchona calisaya]|uniref:Uncharacterized protein n=1 Tax=Cinchona calisaya TaxID=153742 RepID=A0ABD2YTG3_9GENT
MSYFSRVWMAASVAVVNSHSDQGHKWKSGIKTLHHNKKRLLGSSADGADIRPLSGVLASDMEGGFTSGTGEDRRKQADESLRQVIRSWLAGEFSGNEVAAEYRVDRVDSGRADGADRFYLGLNIE